MLVIALILIGRLKFTNLQVAIDYIMPSHWPIVDLRNNQHIRKYIAHRYVMLSIDLDKLSYTVP